MSLKIGVGSRSPLNLLAYDTRLLLLTIRRDERDRPVAVISVQHGDDDPVERLFRPGDELELTTPSGATTTLRCAWSAAVGIPVTFEAVPAG